MSDTINNKYKEKYLKYKQKYVQLKAEQFLRNQEDQEKYLDLKNHEFNRNQNDQEKYVLRNIDSKNQIGGKYDLEILNDSILINDIIYITPVEIRETLIRNKIIPIIMNKNPNKIII